MAGALAALSGPPSARAEEIEAVASKVSDDYVRVKRPDGSFRPEAYAFAKGGYWSGNRVDKTIDKLDFMDVARTIAAPLAAQNYVPAKDPKATRLLIMVYWGTTRAEEYGSDSPVYQELYYANEVYNNLPPGLAKQEAFDEVTTAMAAVQAQNRIRDNMNRRNAMMLGYDSWWNTTFNAQNGTALAVRRQDMLNELERDRYFVVLMAYDFQLLLKDKKHKLLWETRFSIDEHHNGFDKELATMALYASRYFGRDSNGLRHDPVPEGRVEVGDVKDLGVVPGK